MPNVKVAGRFRWEACHYLALCCTREVDVKGARACGGGFMLGGCDVEERVWWVGVVYVVGGMWWEQYVGWV